MTNREFFLGMLEREPGLTRKVLGAVPDGNLEWRPHPDSRSVAELVGHLLGHVQDLHELATEGTIHHRMQVPYGDAAHSVEIYDSSMTDLRAAIGAMDNEVWGRHGTMYLNDEPIYEGTTYEMMWAFLFDHIHHRGQLTTYLRPLGAKVPSIYGPSADDDGH